MNIQGLNQVMGLFTNANGVSSGNCCGNASVQKSGQSAPVDNQATPVMTRSKDENRAGDSTPEVDYEKVERLKQQVETGEYQVDEDSIASKILGMFKRDKSRSRAPCLEHPHDEPICPPVWMNFSGRQNDSFP